MDRQNFDYLLYMGLDDDDDDDNWDEAEAQRVLQAGEGRNEEASGSGQAGHGAAAAAAEAGEGAGEGPSAAGAAGPVDDGNQEGAAGGHGQENEPQPQEPDRGAMGDNQGVVSLAERWSCVHPVRLLAPKFHHQHRFTLAQLQELESSFQRSQYLSAEEAKRLASCMGVTEARLQRWFWKRRENTEDVRDCEHPEVLLRLPIISFSEDYGGDLECHSHQVSDAHEIWLLPKPR